MSAQFGKCSFDGKPVDPKDLDRVRPILTPYGPDGEGYFCKDNVGILYRAFHTTKESHNELQPYLSKSGAVMTWDGRLDNRKELNDLWGGELSADSTDLSIVAAAYEQWRTDSFARLIGDWAISIWDPRTRSLILAKDFVGTRHLYYSVENGRVTWCTILDPLVLFADRSLVLEEEYIAGWLSFFPATHLTPYVGIHSVPPSCFVRLAKGTRQIERYWAFTHAAKIRYRTDAEYEEHFRVVFGQSVRRRLRSATPVLAELSGGMDSSSIVCMADNVVAGGVVETPRLDTVSYYNDSEPNWNERPYFTRVEAQRGRTGLHIDIGRQELHQMEVPNGDFAAIPGSIGCASNAANELRASIKSQGYRVILSGNGGDEVMGGVPTPTPELQDLLAAGQLGELSHQLRAWALNKRIPWFHLLLEAGHGFLPPALTRVPKYKRPVPWLKSDFVKRNRPAVRGYEERTRLFGSRPSLQENISTLEALRRQMACVTPVPLYEKCCPYLDRSLLEFLYSIPREQLIRPGQRRSLMRRALLGVVPGEILNRRRKAFVVRGPRNALSKWSEVQTLIANMILPSLGVVEQSRLSAAVRDAIDGHEVPIVRLMRTLYLEFWLRSLSNGGFQLTLRETSPDPREANGQNLS